MKKFFNLIPLPIAGLMLALASTGNLVANYSPIYKNIFGAISAIIFICLVLKFFINPKSVIDDLKNPVIASVTPTFSMGVIILSTYIKPYSYKCAFMFWILGIIIHFVLMLYFTIKFIFKFDIKKVFPSYFIVYVGIVVVSLTAPNFNALTFGRTVFWFGFICYLILLPIVLYRVLVIKQLPKPTLPLITIFAAPASLCLAGYINSFEAKNSIIIGILLALSLITLITVIILLPKFLKIEFYPSYSAFTFPLVISAIALKASNKFLGSINMKSSLLNYISKASEYIAIIIVLYVLIRYVHFIYAKLKTKTNLTINS